MALIVEARTSCGRALAVLALGAGLLAVSGGSAMAQSTGAAADDRAYRANVERRLSSFQSELRALTGEVERLQYENQRLRAGLERLTGDVDRRLLDLEGGETGTPPAPGSAAPAPSGAATDTATVADNGSGTASAGPGVLPAGPLTEQYAFAHQLVLQTRYAEAEVAFKEFLASHGDSRLAENARYWLGETYYVRRRYQDAAQVFLEGWKAAPQGQKAPDNLLKLGLSLGAIGKSDEACVTLAELGRQYPQAPGHVLARADEERRSLACS